MKHTHTNRGTVKVGGGHRWRSPWKKREDTNTVVLSSDRTDHVHWKTVPNKNKNTEENFNPEEEFSI